MILKNNEQRKQFLKRYENWECIGEVPELKLKFYKYTLPTNAVIIATEWLYPATIFLPAQKGCRFCLITRKDHKGVMPELFERISEYSPRGTPEGTIIDYLRINKCDVEGD